MELNLKPKTREKKRKCVVWEATVNSVFKISIIKIQWLLKFTSWSFFFPQKSEDFTKQQVQKKPKAGMDLNQRNTCCIRLVSSPNSSKQIYSSRSKARSSPGSSLHWREDGEDNWGEASEEGKGDGVPWRGAAPGLLLSSDKPEGHFFSEWLCPNPPCSLGRAVLFPWLRRHSCSFSLSRAVFYRKR